MKTDKKTKQQVSEAVRTFLMNQMSWTPASISVDIHSESLVVTFCGATSLAERDCAEDMQVRERIERCYRELFDVTGPTLNTALEAVVGRQVERSKLSVDVVSGDGVVVSFFRPLHRS